MTTPSPTQPSELEQVLIDAIHNFNTNDMLGVSEDTIMQKSIEQPLKDLTRYVQSAVLAGKIDPFAFVEPCEPECSPERHAYHQGQWDMATRIEAAQATGQEGTV